MVGAEDGRGDEIGVLIAVVALLHPEADGVIGGSLDTQECHEVVRRYCHVGAIGARRDVHDVTFIIDVAAFDHIERVGERGVASLVLHNVLEASPVGRVELINLRADVGHIEGLLIGLTREETVGRGYQVAAAVVLSAGAVERLCSNPHVARQLGVVGKGLVAARHLLGARVAIKAEGNPTGVHPLGVVLQAVVHHLMAVELHGVRDKGVTRLAGRNLDALVVGRGDNGSCGLARAAPLHITGHLVGVVIARREGHGDGESGKRQRQSADSLDDQTDVPKILFHRLLRFGDCYIIHKDGLVLTACGNRNDE